MRGDREPLEWRVEPARLKGEVEGFCATCGEFRKLLADLRWKREGRELLAGRRRGGGFDPVADAFE